MTLHLIYSSAGLDAARERSSAGDVLVLLGDAVYRAQSETMPASESTFILDEDCRARGLSLPAECTVIDYARLVELCIEHQPIVSWND